MKRQRNALVAFNPHIAFELVTFAPCSAFAVLMEQMIKGMQRILLNALRYFVGMVFLPETRQNSPVRSTALLIFISNIIPCWHAQSGLPRLLSFATISLFPFPSSICHPRHSPSVVLAWPSTGCFSLKGP